MENLSGAGLGGGGEPAWIGANDHASENTQGKIKVGENGAAKTPTVSMLSTLLQSGPMVQVHRQDTYEIVANAIAETLVHESGAESQSNVESESKGSPSDRGPAVTPVARTATGARSRAAPLPWSCSSVAAFSQLVVAGFFN